ncbi:hypothetical protein IWZ00DRAFT_384508 [Phyllosticta capitalensis]
MFAWSVDSWLAGWVVGWFVGDSGRPSAWTVKEQVRKTKRIGETRAARFAEPDPASPMEPTEENVLGGSESRQEAQPDSGVNQPKHQQPVPWCQNNHPLHSTHHTAHTSALRGLQTNNPIFAYCTPSQKTFARNHLPPYHTPLKPPKTPNRRAPLWLPTTAHASGVSSTTQSPQTR